MCGADCLPAGNLTDKGLDRVNVCIKELLALSPEDYHQPKASNQRTNLDDIAELLDHQRNPGAYRICQDAVLDGLAVSPLLGLALKCANDAVCNKSVEVLARLAFGNARGAEAIASDPGFLEVIGSLLQRSGPLRLAVLQLAQAVMASSAPVLAPVASEVVDHVAPLLGETTFQVLPLAALEVMISASFLCPERVALAVPASVLESMLAEDESRPAWLPADSQHVLVCGLLATNVILVSESVHDVGLGLSQRMSYHLGGGSFMETFACALEASAIKSEWPQGSGVFHSPGRLAHIVERLTRLGYHRRLVSAVPVLAQIVEVAPDKATTDAALVALRALSRDMECLKALLQLSDFRQSMLHVLCDSGEEVEAKELASYLITAEGVLESAQAILDEMNRFIPRAPGVHVLAELFSAFAPLDGELPAERLPEALRTVPIGPLAAVQASLSGGAPPRGFGFEDFTRHVYGTPTLLGWWPSLMENTAEAWEAALAAPGPSGFERPSLAQLVGLFEQGAEGKSTLGAATLLEQTLPSLGISPGRAAVEEAFARIRGQERLSQEEFGRWLGELYAGLAVEECEEAAAAAAVAAAE